MGRLIDADALIESFRKCYVGHVGMENSDNLMTFKSICRIINEQPTAYDVEKVLAELETLRLKYARLWAVCEDNFEKHELYIRCLQIDKDIEIVRKGGWNNG